MKAAVIVAVIAAVGAVLGAIVSGLYAYRLARTQSKLDEIRDAGRARLDYEYEARKRLYTAYEPVKFQLVDLMGQALRRISALSLVTVDSDSTQLVAAAYEILAPSALVRILDRDLTLADMHLEPQISVEYGLIKTAYRVLADLNSLSSISMSLSASHTESNEEGLLPHELDEAVDTLIGGPNLDEVANEASAYQPKTLLTYGQFRGLSADVRLTRDDSGLGAFISLLDGFTPESRPIFWRALVTQVLLYGCYLDLILVNPDAESQRLRDLANSLLPQLNHALDLGLRLDKYWMSDERPRYNEVNSQVVRDALECAERYYAIRVLPSLGPGTVAP